MINVEVNVQALEERLARMEKSIEEIKEMLDQHLPKKQPSPLDDYVSAKEYCEAVGITDATFQRWKKVKIRGAVIKVGGKNYVHKDQLRKINGSF